MPFFLRLNTTFIYHLGERGQFQGLSLWFSYCKGSYSTRQPICMSFTTANYSTVVITNRNPKDNYTDFGSRTPFIRRPPVPWSILEKMIPSLTKLRFPDAIHILLPTLFLTDKCYYQILSNLGSYFFHCHCGVQFCNSNSYLQAYLTKYSCHTLWLFHKVRNTNSLSFQICLYLPSVFLLRLFWNLYPTVL